MRSHADWNFQLLYCSHSSLCFLLNPPLCVCVCVCVCLSGNNSIWWLWYILSLSVCLPAHLSVRIISWFTFVPRGDVAARVRARVTRSHLGNEIVSTHHQTTPRNDWNLKRSERIDIMDSVFLNRGTGETHSGAHVPNARQPHPESHSLHLQITRE